MKAIVVTTYATVTKTTPAANASGRVRLGSRTSPATRLASQNPPKEKKTPMKPRAMASPSGCPALSRSEKRYDMGPTSVTDRECGEHHACEGKKLQSRHGREHASAERHAGDTDQRQDPDRANCQPWLDARSRGPNHHQILRQTRCQCCGDAGIHDQKRLPAIEKRDLTSPPLLEVHVEATGLRISRRQLTKGQRTGKDQRTAGEPQTKRQGRGCEGTNQLCRRQKNADSDGVTGNERRRGPEAE